MTNQIDESQFKLVAELLERQDEALEQLKTLCKRVEQAIEENVGSRETEESADQSGEIGELAVAEVRDESDQEPQIQEQQDLKAA